MNLRDYVACKGKVHNIHNVNQWLLWHVREPVMILHKLWNTFRTARVRSTVRDGGSIFLPVPVPVLVVLQGYVQNQRRGRMTENKAQLSN